MSTDHRKSEIEQAARMLFAECPYAAVSVKAIRVAAGASNGSFFFVFSSKLALATVLYRSACVARDRRIAEALAEWPSNPHRALATAFRTLIHFLISSETDARLLRHLRDAVTAEPEFENDPDGLAGLTAALTPWINRPATRQQIASLSPSLIAILLLAPARSLVEGWGGFPAAEVELIVEQLSACLWRALEAVPVKKPRAHRTSDTSSQGGLNLTLIDPPR